MKIKEIPKILRPREKLIRYGSDKLTNSELLAIIVSTGYKNAPLHELAGKLDVYIKNNQQDSVDIHKLMVTTGLGKAKACSISACLELGKRVYLGKKYSLVLSPADVWTQMLDIRDQRREHFVVFYLDIRNQIIKREVISIGTVNASLVHPREVFEPAIRDGASQLILCHNHPSDIVDPSDEDILLTKRLLTGGEILGIEVLDHIIVSKTTYCSFKESGII